jgi:hypothetical protein
MTESIRRTMTLNARILRTGLTAMFTATASVLKHDPAAQVRPLIAAKWETDKAVKLARVDAVNLSHVVQAEYRGQAEWHMKQSTSTEPRLYVACQALQ